MRFLSSLLLFCACALHAQVFQPDCKRTPEAYTAKNIEYTKGMIKDHEAWVKSTIKGEMTRFHPGPEDDFTEGDYPHFNFARHDLRYGAFAGTDLTRAEFTNTDLRFADLRSIHENGREKHPCLLRTLLNGAHLFQTQMTGTLLQGADLAHTIFEPASLPLPEEVATARNLDLITFRYNPGPLIQMRKSLADTGFSRAAAEITYALHRRNAEFELQGCRADVRPGWPFNQLFGAKAEETEASISWRITPTLHSPRIASCTPPTELLLTSLANMV